MPSNAIGTLFSVMTPHGPESPKEKGKCVSIFDSPVLFSPPSQSHRMITIPPAAKQSIKAEIKCKGGRMGKAEQKSNELSIKN